MASFLIVDGSSIAYRAFYALPFLTNHEGKASGAIFGFANILIKILSEQKPTHVAVAFDHSRKTFRNELYADYKGQRKPTPEEMIAQMPIITQMLSIMGIQTYEYNNIEADDIIGTICKTVKGDKFVLSGDRDLLQLIDSHTSVWLTKKGVSEVNKVDLQQIGLEFHIRPDQVMELKGLMGDASDNIPGVKGVGEKTALSLLEKYDTIDGVYAHIDEIAGKLKEKLIEGKEMAYLSKQLATIKTDCDFPFNEEDCRLSFPFNEETAAFFKQWDFTSLLRNPALFSNIAVENIAKKKINAIELTQEVLNRILEQKPKEFAYDLQSLTFSPSAEERYFLTKNYDMFGSNLTAEYVCQTLKPIFEDASILKLTTSAKEDMHILDKYQVGLNNFFDIALAKYVVNAGLKIVDNAVDVNEYFSLQQELESQMKTLQVEHVYNDIELPLVPILFQMEQSGFKINESRVHELDALYTERLAKLSEQIYADAGEIFNINSPKQVAHILFEKLGIQAYNNKKQSTSVSVLDELRFIPIVDNILKHRKLAKLKNTYIDVYSDICRLQGDIIHTRFNQTLTSTGRLSSSEPNLQTIPTRDEDGRELRKLFISKFENGELISADYNQIELRLLASMSGESHLIEAYRNNEDIHTLTASQIFGIPLCDVTAEQRREAKAVNFGIIYGISDYGLSQNIKSSRAQAKQYIDSYFTRYPRVKLFMEQNVEKAKTDGFIRTLFGRIRKIPEINSSKFITRSFGERVAMNMPLQGTASDIIKIAMLRVSEAFHKEHLRSELILQIHDELIIDVFPGEADVVSHIMTEVMEHVSDLEVPLLATIGKGKDLFECK